MIAADLRRTARTATFAVSILIPRTSRRRSNVIVSNDAPTRWADERSGVLTLCNDRRSSIRTWVA